MLANKIIVTKFKLSLKFLTNWLKMIRMDNIN